jgi:hypothetical protein
MKDLSKTSNLSRYSVLRQILRADISSALKQVVSEFSGKQQRRTALHDTEVPNKYAFCSTGIFSVCIYISTRRAM